MSSNSIKNVSGSVNRLQMGLIIVRHFIYMISFSKLDVSRLTPGIEDHYFTLNFIARRVPG